MIANRRAVLSHAAMSSLTPILGWCAGVVALAAGLPQVIRLIRSGNTNGVSTWTYVVWTLTVLWWALWAIRVGAVPSYVTNLLCVPILGVALVKLGPGRWPLVTLASGAVLAGGVDLYWVPLLAVGGSVFQAIIATPSVVTALQRDADLSGVSISTWVLLIVGNVLWVGYDVGIGFALAGVVPVLSSVTAIIVIVKARAFRSVHP